MSLQRLSTFIFLFSGALCSFARADEINYEIVSNFLHEELDSWKVPEELKTKYTYYQSGYDEEGRPLWIGELGKWNIRKQVEGGNGSLPNFNKYVDLLVRNIISSVDLNSTDRATPKQIVGIIDLEAFDWYQLSSAPTVAFILKKFKELVPIILEAVHSAYLVNTNFMAERLVSLLRPILGSALERVEIFGTNKAKYIHRLLQKIPEEQLPEWYGGSKDFAPVKVYG